MNLENLISQYIDGELSNEEDLLLRDLIRNDNLTRDKFNASVELHLELKEDSDAIKVPEELLRSTEDKIMMQILNAQTATITKLDTKRSFINFKRLSYAAAAIFLFAISSIFEFDSIEFGNNSISNLSDNTVKINKSASNSDNSVEIPKKNQITEKNRLESNSLFASDDNKSDNNQIELVGNLSINESPVNANTSLVENSADFINTVNTAIPTDNVIKNEIISSNNVNSESSSKPGTIGSNNLQLGRVSQNVGNMNSALIFDQFLDKNEIRLESNYGQDFARGGISTTNNQAIKHISQSISYNIDESKRIGIECGITEFDYQRVTKVVVGTSSNAGKGSSTEDFGGNDNLGNIVVPVLLNQNHQMFWGTVFYEQTLLSTDILNFDTRVGLGSSNQGVLGFGRLMGKMLVYGPVYLTFGTEGRLFVIDNKMITKNDLSSTFSLIYGIQFKF